MELLTNVFLLVFCLSVAFAQELNEDSRDPLTNFVFDLPDIVANVETLGEEVQLEAFGARQVNLNCKIFFLILC
jgi:hypothetical protein